MKKINISGLDLWKFEGLGKEPSVEHFVTERGSLAGGEEFTLSYSSSPDKLTIQHNRSRLAKALHVSDEKLFFPSQVHKTRILRVTSRTSKDELLDTDALITNEEGICIAVMSADCVPILLYDRINGAVAAIHSGWRGTVAKILEKTLHEMRSVFGTHGVDLLAAIGPSVSQESYEVGGEVIDEVERAFGTAAGLLIPQGNNKAKLDLWKANILQLQNFGVPDNQIEIASLCTVKNNEYFFSARKGDSGRFAAGIVLQPK
jgi:polyphenol oxidase